MSHRDAITALQLQNASGLARWVYLRAIGAQCADLRTDVERAAYDALVARGRVARETLRLIRVLPRRTAKVIPLRRAAR